MPQQFLTACVCLDISNTIYSHWQHYLCTRQLSARLLLGALRKDAVRDMSWLMLGGHTAKGCGLSCARARCVPRMAVIE